MGVEVVLRRFERSDAEAVLTLFRDTVQRVNCRDYTEEQIKAWVPPSESEAGVRQAERLIQSLLQNVSLVAVSRGEIVGFGDVSLQGYLDHLYVHHAMQGLGLPSPCYGNLNLLPGVLTSSSCRRMPALRPSLSSNGTGTKW